MWAQGAKQGAGRRGLTGEGLSLDWSAKLCSVMCPRSATGCLLEFHSSSRGAGVFLQHSTGADQKAGHGQVG